MSKIASGSPKVEGDGIEIYNEHEGRIRVHVDVVPLQVLMIRNNVPTRSKLPSSKLIIVLLICTT